MFNINTNKNLFKYRIVKHCGKAVSALCGIFASAMVIAGPTGGVYEYGGGSIQTPDAFRTNVIAGAGNNSLIKWDTFNIVAGEEVNFIHSGAKHRFFNDIQDINPSIIDGNINGLNPNTSIYLFSRRGMINVNSGAQINLTGDLYMGSLTPSNKALLLTNIESDTFNGVSINMASQGILTVNNGASVIVGGDMTMNANGILEATAGLYTTTLDGSVSVGGDLNMTAAHNVNLNNQANNISFGGNLNLSSNVINIAGDVVTTNNVNLKGGLNTSNVSIIANNITLEGSGHLTTDGLGLTYTGGTSNIENTNFIANGDINVSFVRGPVNSHDNTYITDSNFNATNLNIEATSIIGTTGSADNIDIKAQSIGREYASEAELLDPFNYNVFTAPNLDVVAADFYNDTRLIGGVNVKFGLDNSINEGGTLGGLQSMVRNYVDTTNVQNLDVYLAGKDLVGTNLENTDINFHLTYGSGYVSEVKGSTIQADNINVFGLAGSKAESINLDSNTFVGVKNLTLQDASINLSNGFNGDNINVDNGHFHFNGNISLTGDMNVSNGNVAVTNFYSLIDNFQRVQAETTLDLEMFPDSEVAKESIVAQNFTLSNGNLRFAKNKTTAVDNVDIAMLTMDIATKTTFNNAIVEGAVITTPLLEVNATGNNVFQFSDIHATDANFSYINPTPLSSYGMYQNNYNVTNLNVFADNFNNVKIHSKDLYFAPTIQNANINVAGKVELYALDNLGNYGTFLSDATLTNINASTVEVGGNIFANTTNPLNINANLINLRSGVNELDNPNLISSTEIYINPLLTDLDPSLQYTRISNSTLDNVRIEQYGPVEINNSVINGLSVTTSNGGVAINNSTSDWANIDSFGNVAIIDSSLILKSTLLGDNIQISRSDLVGDMYGGNLVITSKSDLLIEDNSTLSTTGDTAHINVGNNLALNNSSIVADEFIRVNGNVVGSHGGTFDTFTRSGKDILIDANQVAFDGAIIDSNHSAEIYTVGDSTINNSIITTNQIDISGVSGSFTNTADGNLFMASNTVSGDSFINASGDMVLSGNSFNNLDVTKTYQWELWSQINGDSNIQIGNHTSNSGFNDINQSYGSGVPITIELSNSQYNNADTLEIVSDWNVLLDNVNVDASISNYGKFRINAWNIDVNNVISNVNGNTDMYSWESGNYTNSNFTTAGTANFTGYYDPIWAPSGINSFANTVVNATNINVTGAPVSINNSEFNSSSYTYIASDNSINIKDSALTSNSYIDVIAPNIVIDNSIVSGGDNVVVNGDMVDINNQSEINATSLNSGMFIDADSSLRIADSQIKSAGTVYSNTNMVADGVTPEVLIERSSVQGTIIELQGQNLTTSATIINGNDVILKAENNLNIQGNSIVYASNDINMNGNVQTNVLGSTVSADNININSVSSDTNIVGSRILTSGLTSITGRNSTIDSSRFTTSRLDVSLTDNLSVQNGSVITSNNIVQMAGNNVMVDNSSLNVSNVILASQNDMNIQNGSNINASGNVGVYGGTTAINDSNMIANGYIDIYGSNQVNISGATDIASMDSNQRVVVNSLNGEISLIGDTNIWGDLEVELVGTSNKDGNEFISAPTILETAVESKPQFSVRVSSDGNVNLSAPLVSGEKTILRAYTPQVRAVAPVVPVTPVTPTPPVVPLDPPVIDPVPVNPDVPEVPVTPITPTDPEVVDVPPTPVVPEVPVVPPTTPEVAPETQTLIDSIPNAIGAFTPMVVKTDDTISTPIITNNQILIPVVNNNGVEVIYEYLNQEPTVQ